MLIDANYRTPLFISNNIVKDALFSFCVKLAV